MARREVRVLTVPKRDGEQAQQIGRMVDPGDGRDPFGTDANSDKMLAGGKSRQEKFDYYYAGWSNGYVQTQAA